MTGSAGSIGVKICGITCLEDALGVAGLGVDAIGFNLHPGSPRYIEPGAAREIVAALPSFVLKVGVFVDMPGAKVDSLAREIGLDRLQLHGTEDVNYCGRRFVPVIKVFRTSPGWDVAEAEPFRGRPILLDGYRRGLAGGTGELAHWGTARILVERGYEVILAGGLSPENVVEADEAVRPAAVDLNSGVESSPGRKDLGRVARALEVLGRLPRRRDVERRLTNE